MSDIKVKYKGISVGIIYFIVHFILEVTCFYVLASYTKSNAFWYIALCYDLFAFVPQAFVGALSDKFRHINFGLIGISLIIISLIIFSFNMSYILVLLFLTIGNCMIHVSGAEATLRVSEGKIFPCSLFVSGGAIGIITGRLLYTFKVSVIYIIVFNIVSILLVVLANKYKKYEKLVLDTYNYSNKKINPITVIVLATFVVAIRSFMSYGIPTTWNKTILDAILLYLFMMIGKALGGYLVDNIGIRKTIYLSTIVAFPFLMFGGSIIYVSLIGVLLFSMTMAITLAIIVSETKENPGIGFGFTTIGLFLGSLPMFFVKLNNSIVNGIIFTIFTVLCIIILEIIVGKEVK